MKILLMTLPYLIPLIPPMGISCLKSNLQKNGFRVKAVDGMAEIKLRELCYRYFERLEEDIPVEKRGYLYNVGLDVLSNHFMAHINHTDENKYIELVKLVVYRNFFVEIENHRVRELNTVIADFYTELEHFLARCISEEKPSILGLSVIRGNLGPSLFAAKKVKEQWPEIECLMGGAIFSQDLFPGTPNFDSFLDRTPYIDKIFIGEGEKLLVDYLYGRIPGDKRIYSPGDIDNQLLDLNSLDVPDFSDFDLSAYPLLPAFTSRGCVYKCSFCAETLFWKRYNRKNPQRVADELTLLSRRYGKKVFVLTDCLINPLVTELSNELIAREKKIYWDVTIKVDKHTCDPQYTVLWRQGGLYRVRLGIESGSQNLLNIIDKKISLEQIKASLISLASAGIKTTTYWIAGHPGETETDFRQTLDLIEELQDYIYEVECNPFRFFYSGQVNAGTWNDKRRLYPEDDTDMLLNQTWVLNEEPSREVIYERVCLIKEHCKKLGIPNPYSVGEIREADERWQRLQKNAVPPFLELERDPGRGDKEIRTAVLSAENDRADDDVDFNF